MTIFFYILFFLCSSIVLFGAALKEITNGQIEGLVDLGLCLMSIVHLFYWGYNPKIMIWIITIAYIINMHVFYKKSRLALLYLLIVFPGLYLIVML